MSVSLGDLEQAILLAVLRLGEDRAYGRVICGELEDRTGRAVSQGAAYVTLDRLESKGLVESWLGDTTPERGGRRKRHFRVTAPGMAALRTSRRALLSLWEGVEQMLEET